MKIDLIISIKGLDSLITVCFLEEVTQFSNSPEQTTYCVDSIIKKIWRNANDLVMSPEKQNIRKVLPKNSTVQVAIYRLGTINLTFS